MKPSEASETEIVTVYTDGACIGNPGRGGYGVVVLQGNSRREVSGGFRRTTNNRMELMAAIVGLELLAPRSTVMLYTDSKYLEAPINRGWAKKWRTNGWRTKKGRRTNYDLWEHLIYLCNKHNVKFLWVRGHAGNRDNERCDFLAMLAANADSLPIDRGYEQPAPLVPPTEQLSLKF